MTTTAPSFRIRPGDLGAPVNQDQFRTARARVDVARLQVQREGGRFDAGVLVGVSLISTGEALGHGFWIDGVTLDQVEHFANGAEETGVKSRFTHPSMSSDGTGKHLGRIHEVYREGDRVLGTLNFAASSRKTPDGDLGDYVMTLAEEDPRAAGLSIVFGHDREQEIDFLMSHGAELREDDHGSYLDLSGFKSPDPANTENYPHVRLAELRAADVVDEPAANPEGLFDRQTEARQADGFLSYALGITDQKPDAVFGIDPERAKQFLSRWMEQHSLALRDPATTEEPEMGATAEQEKTREELRAEFTAELNRYTEAFGTENGTQWFNDGVSFSDAQGKHIEALTAERDELAEEVTTLKKQLEDIQLGEVEPVDVSPEDSGKVDIEDFFQVPTPSEN